MTTARIYGVPIIGDVDEHRMYAGLRRGAVIVAQDAAEAFAARDRCNGIDVLVGRRRDRGEQPVVDALVVALEMVVLDELRDRDAEVALTEWNGVAEFRSNLAELEKASRAPQAIQHPGATEPAKPLGKPRRSCHRRAPWTSP